MGRYSQRLRCLLFIFVAVGISNAIFAQHHPPMTAADSLVMSDLQHALLRRFMGEADTFSPAAILEIWREEGTSFQNSTLTLSPDQRVKIFTLEVENCGAFCNSNWYSWVQFEQYGALRCMEISGEMIDEIHLLGKGKYVLLSSSHGRLTATSSVDCRAVSLLEWSGNSWVQTHIPYDGKNHFSFCQENSVEVDASPEVWYDRKRKRLYYRYAHVDPEDLLQVVVREGYFRYQKGKFSEVTERMTLRH